MKKLTALLSILAVLIAFPVNAGAVPAADGISLSAECAVVINADTGCIIYGKNETKQHAMASTTKIMTALITLESGDLDRPFTADSMALPLARMMSVLVPTPQETLPSSQRSLM